MPESNDIIYQEMWLRLQKELETLRDKYDVVETVQYYADGKKVGRPMEKRYQFSMSMDDILKLMCSIDTDVRLKHFYP